MVLSGPISSHRRDVFSCNSSHRQRPKALPTFLYLYSPDKLAGRPQIVLASATNHQAKFTWLLSKAKWEIRGSLWKKIFKQLWRSVGAASILLAPARGFLWSALFDQMYWDNWSPFFSNSIEPKPQQFFRKTKNSCIKFSLYYFSLNSLYLLSNYQLVFPPEQPQSFQLFPLTPNSALRVFSYHLFR